jgi:hypothetical protein
MIGVYACIIVLVIACLAMVVQNIIMRGQIATAMETIASLDEKYHTDIDGLKKRLDIQDGIVKENNDMCSENYGLMNRTLAAAEHTQYNALEALNRVTCTRRRLDEMIDSINASTGRHFVHTERLETPESAENSASVETAKEIRKLVNDKQNGKEAKGEDEKDHSIDGMHCFDEVGKSTMISMIKDADKGEY